MSDVKTDPEKACYDNPLFPEEEGQFDPDGQKSVNSKYERAKDYAIDGIPGQDVQFKGKDSSWKRKICIFAAVVLCVALIAIIVGFLVTYMRSDDKQTTTLTSIVPSVLFRANTFSGGLRIIGGPFSIYTPDFQSKDSQAYIYFSESFLLEIGLMFHKSQFSSLYNFTTINSVSSGVIVLFTVYFKSSIDISSTTEQSIRSLIASHFAEGFITVDRASITIQALRYPVTSPVPSSSASPDTCQPISIHFCVNKTQYSKTVYPNAFNHMNKNEVSQAIVGHESLFGNPCYEYSLDFWCSAYNPECSSGTPVLPCKQYCIDVRDNCPNVNWPLNCDTLPDSLDQGVCRQNPFQPGKCVDIPAEEGLQQCTTFGYTQTSFPNYAGNINPESVKPPIGLIINIQAATKCYKYSTLFACATYLPKCSGENTLPNHTIPPCRSLCEAYKSNCFMFWEIFSTPWPASLNCSLLPDVNDTAVCIGYKEANEPPRIEDCDIDEQKCDITRCIPKSYICDGYQDCEDDTDEKFCASCPVGKQKCQPVSNLCIDDAAVCDGVRDCYESVDESECLKLGSSDSILYVNNGTSKQWEAICSDGWNETFSQMACRQLGYSDVLTFHEANGTFAQTSLLGEFNASGEANETYLQSYLMKSTDCPAGNVVKLTCANPICGTRPAHYNTPKRIVNGAEVKPGTWPWMVSVVGGPSLRFFCGGSLIGSTWVLTAAHCIGGKENTDGFTLLAGDTRRYAYSKYRQVKQAKTFYVHKDYSPETVENDIALVELDSPVVFNDYVRPICLPDSATLVGTRCFAAGWGRSGDNAEDYEPALREVDLDVVGWSTCESAIGNADNPAPYRLMSKMMCAGGGLDHDACAGDSGGPLICPKSDAKDSWYVAGVISWGLGCAVPNVPGIYTEVYKYVDWIRNITQGEIHIP